MKMELRNRTNEDVVIFSHECADNSIRKTVEEAVKQGVSLAGADLTDANLSKVNLSGADLTGAKCDESQKDIILKAISLVFHEGKEEK